MSLDYSIFGKDLDRFNATSFADWAKDRGYDVELHPQFDLTQGGFQPMRLGDCLTGLEIDLDDYVPEPVYVKQTFFERLFRKKPELTVLSEESRDANQVIWLSCSAQEPLETAAAHLLGAYFCEKFGAKFDDPQTGCVDSRAEVVLITADELLEAAKKTTGHPFRGWGNVGL